MTRKIIPVSHSLLTSLDLDAFVRQAKALNQQNREHFTTPFPKRPSRWISHYQFQPRPITFTDKGAIEGGLSWLVGATLDFSFARDLCSGAYGTRGGHCYDPASLLFPEAAAKVDGYPGYQFKAGHSMISGHYARSLFRPSRSWQRVGRTDQVL